MITQIRFNKPQEVFEYYFNQLKVYGHLMNDTRCLFNQSFTILFPLNNLIETTWRRWDRSYADLEYEWYRTGNRNPETVEARAKIWSNIKDASGLVNSNYGYFWNHNDQLNKMIEQLKKNPTTRRALIVQYDINDIDNYGLDTPCNIVLNFHVGPTQELNMTVFARSIDLVYGFCNDQYCFSRLQDDVANKLGLVIGTSHYFITNLHVYKKHWYIDERS
jgi:thymidylate synthase